MSEGAEILPQFTRGAYWPSNDYSREGLRYYDFTQGFRFYIGAPGSPWWVEVETGSRSDLASVPRWARSFIREDRMIKSGAVHDKCRRDRTVPLWLGNLIFLHAMGVEKTPLFERACAFVVVWFNRRRD